MTRTQEYDFTPLLNHPLFSEPVRSKVDLSSGRTIRCLPAWSTIFRNKQHEGEQYRSGKFGSLFRDLKLVVRHLTRDDIFDNTWWQLRDWLPSISTPIGLVGYYQLDCEVEETTLVYFRNGRVFEQPADDSRTLDNFLQLVNYPLAAAEA